MAEPTAPLPPDSGAPPESQALSAEPAPRLACDRCGTFVAVADAVTIGPRRVCRACAALLRKELRLYPYGYVVAMGLLGNFAVASVLAAINWRRLGDRARARTSLVIATLGLVWLGVAIRFDLPQLRLGLPVNLGATLGVTAGLREIYAQHRQEGGARANLVWPVLALIGLLALMAGGYIVYAVLTGQVPPDQE